MTRMIILTDEQFREKEKELGAAVQIITRKYSDKVWLRTIAETTNTYPHSERYEYVKDVDATYVLRNLPTLSNY